MSTEATTAEFNQRAYAKLQKWLQHLEPVHYRGYSVKALLAKELVYLAYERTVPARMGWKEVLRQVRYAYDYKALKKLTDTHRVVVTVLHPRPDQRAYAESVKSRISQADIFDNSLRTLPRVVHYRGKHLVAAANVVWHIPGLTYYMRVHLLIQVVQKLNTLHLLSCLYKNATLRQKVLVAFNAPYAFDALLTEFFHQHGAVTYSLQHGIFYTYKKFIPYDIINYLFTNTDKILCWGEGSVRRLAQDYHLPNSKLLVAGNARYADKVRRPIRDRSFASGLVMLGRFVYDETNFRLLELIHRIQQTAGIAFTVRPHPSFVMNERQFREAFAAYALEVDESESLSQTLAGDKYSFTISSNTGSYVEAYFAGLICLRYAAGENETIEGIEDQFHDEATFLSIVERIKKTSETDLQKKIDEMLAHELAGNRELYHQL